ncbi:uncharacterized protein A1O5_09808 [Cladophialophora psammophila CBS 110553]|uniref:Uncharacterized protein n=1 Tax=Cladophialophora psammophila CBS 110553 TaxID=1182543 RepID=W9WR56_9EURO|nr:uncharacterized protein A1O5_09808 [Cladophialophora psammophila CBS 110553]EXJ67161.1 hypothetical protein A1O5_09808 [Cladophialophora psammophila CBS 110553]
MAVIKSILFDHITFRATRDQLSRVLETPFATFGPFVRKVTFRPSLCSPDVARDDFERLLAIYTCQRGPHHQHHTAEWHEIWYMYQRFGAKCPGTTGTVTAAYTFYAECANEDVGILQNGSLQRAWIAALKTFPGASSFVIGNIPSFWPQGVYFRENGLKAECEFCNDNIRALTTLSAFGDVQLFRVATECLVSANMRIVDFKLDSNVLRTDKFEDLSSQLRFDHTTHFSFYETPYFPYQSRMVHDEFSCFDRVTMLCSTLMKGFQDTVQVLSMERSERNVKVFCTLAHMNWDMKLPALRTLHLTNMPFPASQLQADLGHCRELQCLLFEGCWPREGPRGWKLLFDAIREHPNSLQLHFREVYSERGAFDFDFPNPDVFSDPTPSSPEDEYEIGRRLCLYLAGRGEWNHYLEDWFPNP